MADVVEVKVQEESKGGVKYEVILANPPPDVKAPKIQAPPEKVLSADEIAQKLKAAEERRISLEAKKAAEWTAKLTKIEGAKQKKDEINQEFITQSKETLETKMEQHIEKREEFISNIKEKLKIHAEGVEKTRNSLDQQKEIEKAAIEEKLKQAEALREDNKKKMLERLKEQNTTKITQVKNQVEEIVAQKAEENIKIIETKLSTAEQNRERELQKKIEKARELEKRAEIVRQNKQAASTAVDPATAAQECN